MSRINNLPEYASEYEYIVASECNGELWFWGAFEYEQQAIRAAHEIDGRIIVNR